MHITLSTFPFSFFFFIWCIACVPKKMVQKVAGAAPQTSYQQERKWQETHQLQHHSTDPFLCTPRMTIDVFYTSPTSDTCGFFKHQWHGVISVLGTSAHFYIGFSVLSTAHLYGKSCAPLFCSVGGFCPFVWKSCQTRPEGHMMAWTSSGWLFLVLVHCHYTS